MAIHQPLVSIIIPVFNQQAGYLRECIESAIRQSYENLEIVISDNHSTNETPAIIEAYMQKDKRIKRVKPASHIPLIDHFLFAFDNSAGEFVIFLSSDDLLLPDCVRDSVAPFITNPGLSFVYSNTSFFNDRSKEIISYVQARKEGYYPSGKAIHYFISSVEGSFGGAMLRSEYFKKIKEQFAKFHYGGDFFAFIFLLKYGGAYYLDKNLCNVRVWERTEQSNRIAKHIRDVDCVYNMILDDEKLMSLINNDKKFVIDKCLARIDPLFYSLPGYHWLKTYPDNVLLEMDEFFQNDYRYFNSIKKLIFKNRKNYFGFTLARIIVKLKALGKK